MKSLLLASTLLLAPAATLAAPAVDEARLNAHIKTLSSDAFEGRGPATEGETKTVAYLTEQMKAAGLEPGGDKGADGKRAWTQAVPLLRAEITGTPKVSLNVAGSPQALTQGEEIAVRAALNGQKQVTIADAPLVFVGYGVTAPERNWDDFKGLDVKGKILVVLVNDPDFETQQGDFGGKAMTYYGRWTYKFEEAARKGALGTLIVHETAPASYGWATVKNSNTNTMFDIVRDDPAKAHAPLEAWIQRDLAVALFKASGLDFEDLKVKARARDFQPVPLKATISADFAVNSEVITSRNVVGRVTGKTRPDETVLYTAHWDHLGVAAPDANGDTIYNGAVDNATGTSALIEMGRAFAKAPRPARSVVFLAVTAEEKGLLGSEFYAANPLYPLAKTAGVLNMDGFGVNGPARNFTISGTAELGLLDRLVAEGKKHNRVYSPDPRTEAGGFYRSDHFPFAKRGVPAISYGAGNDLVDGGLARAEELSKDYTAKRYHQPADEWSPDFNMKGLAADIALLFDVGNDLANSTDWPNWSANSEFRGTRDESAADRK
ncbi:M28 family metallopeptidase [Sphingomonas sp. C3-2]|uniref:M28 family metallopeptidase n=1 Tax=Sphingomonas sp. C3-2 TaxID=3062169 RepID=UPI00294ACE62|nr:M28 family metallopeptidase [Sphingomonas sp. C3-2]WOK35426.1 M28 family metallopeptidase [Sphingomonas sp. C3-2]